jgi:type I restriction enzyme, S subunit
MSFPKYDRYKESGVELLGEVPKHWDISSIKRVAEICYGIGEPPKYQIEGIPLIRATNVHAGKISDEGLVYVNPNDIPESRIVWLQAGDIIVVRSGAYTGDSAIIPKDFGKCIAGFDLVLQSKSVDPLFVQFALLSKYLKEGQLDIQKMRAAQPHLNSEELGMCVLALPPLPEQRSIATFLYRETTKIDELITEQQRLIDLLKEKRQAVISHAVTKGLNPDTPMKETAIEWLGEVPEHWEIRALRTLSTVVRGASPRPAGDPKFFGGDAVPWVTVAEITKDNLSDLLETEDFLTEEGAQASRRFKKDTLLYSNSGATLGVPKILRMDACANDGVVGFENLSSKIDILFVYYFLSSITESIREKVKQGSGQPNLNTDIVKAIRLAVPPLDEQRSIVEHIEKISNEFSFLIAEAQHAIALLQERRTALISAAVTGKIDVRNLVAPHP